MYLGILNRFHVRKLQLVTKAFRIRYQRKKDKIVVDDADELLSEYSPSELSDIIAAEDMSEEEDENASLQQDVCRFLRLLFYILIFLCV